MHAKSNLVTRVKTNRNFSDGKTAAGLTLTDFEEMTTAEKTLLLQEQPDAYKRLSEQEQARAEGRFCEV